MLAVLLVAFYAIMRYGVFLVSSLHADGFVALASGPKTAGPNGL
jgi:hypothetical protein